MIRIIKCALLTLVFISALTGITNAETYSITNRIGSGLGNYQMRPNTVATDNSGNVYVSDFHHNRIIKYDANGNFIIAWGSAGTGNGQFYSQWGIAVDSDGNVFVVDQGLSRIHHLP